MKKELLLFLGLALLLVLIAGTTIFYLLPRWQDSPSNEAAQNEFFALNAGTAQARVVEIVEEGDITLGDQTQRYQILNVEILEGDYAGQIMQIDYGRRQIRPPGLDIRPGDKLLVTLGQRPDGSPTAYFTDFVRTHPLLWLLGTFVVFSVVISGWKGVRSLLGMAFSLGVIILYIIPQILNGQDPVLVSIVGAFALLSVTLYLIYGWTLKTHAAVLGTLIALVITGILANFFIDLTRLTGFGSEDALFLVQQPEITINLRGLVMGGMLIGALGVLDDLVTTQASAVFEIHAANPTMKWRYLYRSAMRIGQDHVAATVNTLVLAYAGAALPMLLLFSLSGEQYSYLINLEFVAEEIVRTLVGSLGLIAAVPITTALSSWVAVYHERLGSMKRLLGPMDLGGGHSHSH